MIFAWPRFCTRKPHIPPSLEKLTLCQCLCDYIHISRYYFACIVVGPHFNFDQCLCDYIHISRYYFACIVVGPHFNFDHDQNCTTNNTNESIYTDKMFIFNTISKVYIRHKSLTTSSIFYPFLKKVSKIASCQKSRRDVNSGNQVIFLSFMVQPPAFERRRFNGLFDKRNILIISFWEGSTSKKQVIWMCGRLGSDF